MISFLRRLMIIGSCGVWGFVSCSDVPDLGDVSGPSTTSCNSNIAQIGVQDGFFADLCGCAEENGRWIGLSSGETLTCTVPPGTTVIFQYIGTKLRHRIISDEFVSSPISDPNASAVIRTHVVVLEAEGTYPFSDQYVPGLNGQIIVSRSFP